MENREQREWPRLALDTVVDIKGVAEDPPFRIAATCHSNKCSVFGSAVQKRLVQAGRSLGPCHR